MSQSTSDIRARRVERAAQLTRTLEGALQVVSVVVPDADLSAMVQSVKRAGVAVTSMDPSAKDANERLDSLEGELSRLERELAAVDLRIPMEIFRPRIVDSGVPPVFLVRYARLLGARDLGVGIRRDRFEFVINRVLLHGQARPPYRVAPRDRMERLLFEIAPTPFHLDADKLKQTVGSIEEAERRILALTSHEELFESGVYMDLRGYKLTLRNELLNHDILYAVARANVALANKIAEFTAKDRSLEARIRARLAEQTEEVNAIFNAPTWEAELKELEKQSAKERDRAEAAPQKKKPAPAKAVKAAKHKKPRSDPEDSEDTHARVHALTAAPEDGEREPTDRRRLLLIAAAVAVIGLAVASQVLLDRSIPFSTLPDAEVAELSPYFKTAAVRVDGLQKVLQATVTNEYAKLPPSEQARRRDEIAASIELHEYGDALIYSESTLIMQFIRGKRMDLALGTGKVSKGTRGKRGTD